jgi:hypothetical protein
VFFVQRQSLRSHHDASGDNMSSSLTEPLSLTKSTSNVDKLSDVAASSSNSSNNLLRRENLSSKLHHSRHQQSSTSNKSTSKLGQGHDFMREASVCNGYEQLTVATDNNESSLGTESGQIRAFCFA